MSIYTKTGDGGLTSLCGDVSASEDYEVAVAYELGGLALVASVEQGPLYDLYAYLLQSATHVARGALAAVEVVGGGGDVESAYVAWELAQQFVAEAVFPVDYSRLVVRTGG